MDKAFPTSVVELTQKLVQIPSVNPDGEANEAIRGELNCARFIGEFLKSIGAEVEFQEVLPNRPNVIGRFPSKPSADGKPKRRILFAPHTDTVGVEGMVIEPFGGEVREGKVWGRGSSDTKGPMASMLWAFHELRNEIADLPIEVHFVGFISEETTQHGSRYFSKTYGDQYDFAIIAEPTSLETVFKHKGCLWADIECFGTAMHGSKPELADNAILKMTPVIQGLDQVFRQQLKDWGGKHDWLGETSLSISMIHGGTRPNITAAHCSLTVDIRYTPELLDRGSPLELLEKFVHQYDPEAKVSVIGRLQPCLNTSQENPFVQHLVKTGAPLAGAPWFCDAAYTAEAGIPSVAIGPGSIAQAHTKDEFICISDLESGVSFWQKFLRTLA